MFGGTACQLIRECNPRGIVFLPALRLNCGQFTESELRPSLVFGVLAHCFMIEVRRPAKPDRLDGPQKFSYCPTRTLFDRNNRWEQTTMDNPFFDQPILNSPYDYPRRHWELDSQGQPTQQIIERRRRAEFITPIPKPKKRKRSADQQQIVFDEGKGLSTQKQQYDITAMFNRVRQEVDQWRSLPTPAQVTPETARLLQHWRHHKFNDTRPFFVRSRPLRLSSGLPRSRLILSLGKAYWSTLPQ